MLVMINGLQGYILTSEIDGTIQMKSYLTGNPEIHLALNEDLSIGRNGSSLYGMLLSQYFCSSFFIIVCYKVR
jgi:Adaptor complexes medium subunit family